MIVDDDPDIRDFVEIILEDQGIPVVAIDNGETALARFDEVAPTLVILDVEMPGMSGTEVCRTLRNYSDVPILFLSSRSEDADRIKGLELGADDYVTKPFNERELLARVRGMLRRAAPTPALGRSRFEHYCIACTTCVATPTEACAECAAEPSASGWPLIVDSQFDYLGRVVDGRYVLDRFLGAGAMGSVYRARAKGMLRSFACKIVDSTGLEADEEAEVLRRFDLEVEAMQQLHNPHVVAIYESMKLGEGVFAFLMDLVEGRTLEEILGKIENMKVSLALDLIRQIANGLHEAHKVGLVHRDLKPANIMVERLPASGFFARILDFGIVRATGKAEQTDGFRGTPLFASPEQCLGEPGIDHRSDIYSLGCVFFNCVAGVPPFLGSTPWKVMDGHVNEPIPRVSDKFTEGQIPESLDALITSMLAKNPADRPRDLSVVIGQIDAINRELSVDETRRSYPPVGPGSLRAATAQIPVPFAEYELSKYGARQVGRITCAALGDKGVAAAVGDDGGLVHALDLSGEALYSCLKGPRTAITALTIHGEKRAVFAAEESGAVWYWDLRRPDAARRLGVFAEKIVALTASADGTLLILGSSSGRVISLVVHNGAPKVLVNSGMAVTALAASCENQLLIGGEGGELTSVQLQTGSVRAMQSLPLTATSLTASSDGYLAAALDPQNVVRILGMMDGKVSFTMPAESDSVRALAFAQDALLVGLGIRGNTLGLWHVAPKKK